MICKFGTHTHPEGEVDIDLQQEAQFNDREQLVGKRVRVTLNGLLTSTSPTLMDAKVQALGAAYVSGNKTFALYLPGGATKSQVVLDNPSSIGGVRVVQPPSLPTISRGGYVTNLPYTIVLEADYAATGASLLLRSFEESLEFEGGGPVDGWLKPLNAPGVRQTLRRFDTYRVRQSGFAIGMYARPTPARAIWPAFLVRSGRLGLRSPKPRSLANTDFYTSWDYEFESNQPLIGFPTSWPL